MHRQKTRTICFCNSNIPWGGGEAWHLNAALSFAARGWRVFLLCHPAGELHKRAAEHQEITLIPLRLGRLSFLNPLLLLRLFRFFQRESVDAVIMNLPADVKVAGPAAQKAGVPHIVYRRGSALPVRNSATNRYLYGRVITRLITNSQATREQVLVNNPGLIAAEKIAVIPNGVDIEAFDAALKSARSAARPSVFPNTPFTIGNAGRLNRQKGQHLVLHLGTRLLEAGIDCRVVIAGEGEREAELKALAQRLGLGDKARFCGFMRDLSPFWLSIDVFVLTSLWEGFGNVVIEAGLAEKPVLAFAVSNLPELIQEGTAGDGANVGNGLLFPLPEGLESAALEGLGRSHAAFSGDLNGPWSAALAGMAAALVELAGNAEKREAMGRAGRRLALRYTQAGCMDAVEALLR